MKSIKHITLLLNWILALVVLLFCLDGLGVLEIKQQIIKKCAYFGVIILPLIVLLWNVFAVKPIRKKLLFLILPVVSLIGILKIGDLEILFASRAWETQKIIHQNGDFPYQKVELQIQDVGALGYNHRKVEVTYLTSWFMLTNPVDTNIESRVDKGNEKANQQADLDLRPISVIDSALPLCLEKIDFNNKTQLKSISDGKVAGIESAIEKYYLSEYEGANDFGYSINDVYLNTIEISSDSKYILYWILYRHISGKLNSQILFYDNERKEHLEYVHDFNIHALYNFQEGDLTASNLKKQFSIGCPEIEIIDFDKDALIDVKLTRLYHNGTANAIEEMIIEVSESGCDTLSFKQNWISE